MASQLMNHPINPSAKLLTELFVKAVTGDSTAEHEYFGCILAATHQAVRQHQHDVERYLRTKERGI